MAARPSAPPGGVPSSAVRRVALERAIRACFSPPMLKHNTYFEGGVQSVGFERNGRRHTVGVVDRASSTSTRTRPSG